ncbi:MAG: hypothetical protein AAF490_32520 [Chloroflexota bacterium]
MFKSFNALSVQDNDSKIINRKLTVLCFEESPRMMRLAMLLLGTHGYDVIWAKNAEEFLKLASFYQPKIILIEEKQQIHISSLFLQKINQFSLERHFPQKMLLVVEEGQAEYRLAEGLTAVNIEQRTQNDLADWLSQFKQKSLSSNSVPICE